MKRRDFLALGGATAVAWRPLRAFAQQATLPILGVLNINVLVSANLEGFKRGLQEGGFVDGQNVALEFFHAEGHPERLHELMATLLQRRPAVVIASGGIQPVQVAKAATSTIPIVFTSGVDPVAAGVVASMNRPGGNITGIYIQGRELDGKRLEVLHDLVPAARVVGVITNSNAAPPPDLTEVRNVAENLGIALRLADATIDGEIGVAFAVLVRQGSQAVLMGSDPVLTNARTSVVAASAALGVPALTESRPFPDSGGFASYGPNIPDLYRLAGVLAGRILKGDKPSDLPVQQPTKFELVVNVKSAKSLGIEIPAAALARADDLVQV